MYKWVKETSLAKRLIKMLGPGLISGASNDDPACVGTYAKTGASMGFRFLWAPLVLLPLMIATQFICAKIGIVSGMGLAGVLKRYYPKKITYFIITALIVANTLEAGADLGAMAAAVNLIIPFPARILIPAIAALILLFQFFGKYGQIRNIFKWLTLALFAYIGAGLISMPDAKTILKATFLPEIGFDTGFLSFFVAILGSSISPYLFFWLAYLEVEDEKAKGRKELYQRKVASERELKGAGIDVAAGMLFSNIVVYFVMLSTAAVLFKSGKTDINTAVEAARALEPIAGKAAGALWALGILGVGFLGVPVLTASIGYAVSEAFGMPHGLDKKPARAKGFYTIIAIATAVGMGIDFLGINPIRALFIVEIINGVIAPPILILIMLISNNRVVMGERTNGWGANILGGATALLMTFAAIGFIYSWVRG